MPGNVLCVDPLSVVPCFSYVIVMSLCLLKSGKDRHTFLLYPGVKGRHITLLIVARAREKMMKWAKR